MQNIFLNPSMSKTWTDLIMNNASAPGGYYLGSTLPKELPWYTYNYCNGPHVSRPHYQLPQQAESQDVKLVYVTVVQRHHKVQSIAAEN